MDGLLVAQETVQRRKNIEMPQEKGKLVVHYRERFVPQLRACRMSRGVSLVLVLALTAFTVQIVFAGGRGLAFEAQGESRLTIAQNGEVHRVARTFSVAEPPNPDGYGTTMVVVDETIDTVARSGIEGYLHAGVHATLMDPRSNSRKDRLVVDAVGSVTEIRDHLYFVVEPGCCDALRAAHVFSLYSGKELFAVSGVRLEDVTAELTFLSSPRLVRHLAVHSPGAPDDLRVYGTNGVPRRQPSVIVTWASWKEPIMKVFIQKTAETRATESKTGKAAELRVESVQWEDAEKSSPRRKTMGYERHEAPADPKVIGGVAIILRLAEGGVVRLPIQADRIDVQNASLPPGMAARLAPY
jgi:hypothetical protein